MALSNQDLLKLQAYGLEILTEIDRVCSENGISYSLCGGTMIGARACQGFVPWDDDADIMMDRVNYNRFLEIFPQKCAHGYRLAHHTTCDSFHVLFAKVENTRYSMVEEGLGGNEVVKPVFVDVTVLDGVPNPFAEKCLRLYGMYVSFYLFRVNGQRPNKIISRILFRLLAWPRSNVSRHRLFQRYERVCSKCANPRYLAELMVPMQRTERYKPDLFDAYCTLPFESAQLMNIQNMDSYFLSRYQKTEFPMDEKARSFHRTHCLRLLDGAQEDLA